MKPITALISKMSIPLQSIKKINSYSIFFYFPAFYRRPNRLQKLKHRYENYQALRMKTRMNDSVHVKIQIIKLIPIRVRPGGVNGD